ncbi:glycosyltransferase [uncultured Parabacteroides sp.]|nr:glycosyltransferase [uncultured Parabacteroides sp.]
MKKVSVIMPMYNMELFVGDAIESVVSQTYPNWELLITDDCSTDNSVNVVKKYMERDKRINLFSTDHNTGSPSEPRNISLSQATGELVAFLDSDDMWLPCKLWEQVEFMEENHYSFIYSDVEKVSCDGRRSNRIDHMKAKTYYKDMLKFCRISNGGALITREMIGEVRYKSIPKEDFGFWLDILRKGGMAYGTGRIHALYRVRPNSRSGCISRRIREQWFILRRVERISLVQSLYFMLPFAYNGLIRYLK